MAERAKRWLFEANSDFETAGFLLNAGRYNACAFYSQQAAEKAVKALLLHLNEMPWGHSVTDLLARAIELVGKFENADELLSSARELDRHYIPSRYPDVFPEGTPSQMYDKTIATRTLDEAKKIIGYVSKSIGEKQ